VQVININNLAKIKKVNPIDTGFSYVV